MEMASFVLSVVAVVVAGLSAIYARRQAVEAGRQAVEAEKVTAIEQRRFHSDLRPDIELTCKARDRAGAQAELTVELTGPAGLDRLDEVRVRIRDDMPRQPTPGSLVVEQHGDEVIWGPYRIKSGLRDRPVWSQARAVSAAEERALSDPARAQLRAALAKGLAVLAGPVRRHPVRLEITCFRDGQEPWVLTPEFKVHFTPEMFIG